MIERWLLLLYSVYYTSAHMNINPSEVESSDISGIDTRRMDDKPEWQYEGMPIDVETYRRLAGGRTGVTATTLAEPIIKPARGTRRIYNADETVDIKDYPFMAAILANNELWCGGVIIATDKILTAAHCLQLQYNNRFFREYVRMMTVRIGSTNATDGGQVLKVSEIFFHPNYVPQTLQFNLAVLILNKNVTFIEDKIQSIDYAIEEYIPAERNISFLGWGSTEDANGQGGEVLLQKVVLPIYQLQDCQEIYGRELVTRNNFCAGYISIAKNVCNHDAGGPAILDGQVLGILSFSYGRCNILDKPAVFTSIGPSANWLINIDKRSASGYNIAG